jgi:putative peptide zinc metalloprotease protein
VSVSAERAPGSTVARRSSRTSAPERTVVPARADGVELLGPVEGSGYDRAPGLVRRADGQNVQLTPIVFQLLEAIDGTRDHAELASILGERTGRAVTAEDVAFLVEEKLRPLGLLRAPDGCQPSLDKPNPLLALHLKYVVSNPAVTRRIAAPFAALFHPAIVLGVVAAFAFVTGWLLLEKGLASAFHQAIYDPPLLLLVFALTILSAGFHELGHAAACRYSGADPGAMGVGLYLVWPAFYTDVTDSYRLDRRSRLRVDLGGLYFNAIFAVATVAASLAVGWDALLLVVAAQLYQMVRQLIPIVRFDGYHVLADIVGVPDLFRHIKPTLASAFRRGRDESLRLKPWARAVVTTWVLAVVPLLAAMVVFAILVVPRIVATAADSLALRWDGVGAQWEAGNLASVTSGVLSMLLVALPAVGIPYLLFRLGWRTGRSTWRWTEGNPTRRAAVLTAGTLVLSGVLWAWWPHEQYRPVEPTERWGLVSSVRGISPAPVAPVAAPADTEPVRGLMVVLMATQPDGSAGPTVVVAPALPVPDDGDASATATETTGDPALTETVTTATVATTTTAATTAAAASAAPSEPRSMPYGPTRTPQEGDNRVVVVNTTDGATRHSTSLSLVWVTGGDAVDQWNEAWALASCTGCRTVAIAFQVVLAVGSSPVVTPVNAAVAVNNECQACVTHALALQLVATLTRQPDEETVAELERLWKQLEQASGEFERLSLVQVRDQLVAAEQQILELLADVIALPSGETGTTTTGTGTTSTSTTSSNATTTGTTTTTPTTTTTARASTTGTTTTAPATTTEPTTTGSTTTTPTTTTEQTSP